MSTLALWALAKGRPGANIAASAKNRAAEKNAEPCREQHRLEDPSSGLLVET